VILESGVPVDVGEVGRNIDIVVLEYDWNQLGGDREDDPNTSDTVAYYRKDELLTTRKRKSLTMYSHLISCPIAH